MATVSGTSLSNTDSLECLICTKAVKVLPKVRSCYHALCFQCLNAFCAAKSRPTSENGLACPVCRKTFSISGGFEDVSHNDVFQRMLEAKKALVAQSFDKPPVCELCSSFERIEIVSTSYCIDCEQHMCDRCKVPHRNAKISRTHRVMRHINILSATDAAKLALSYCDEHPSEIEQIYCYDCKEVMCLMCVSEHSKHDLTDVEKSAEKLREQLSEGVKEVFLFASQKRKESILLEKDMKIFVGKMAAADDEISKQYKLTMMYLELHYCQLSDQLKQFKEEKLKGMKRRKDESEEEFVMAENFRIHCVKVMNKGTACEISRIANELLSKAAELVTIPFELVSKTIDVKLESLFTMNSKREFLNGLVFKDRAAAALEKRYKRKLDLKAFLSMRKSFRLREIGYITGLTILANTAYVVRGASSAIDVYESDNFSELARKLTNTGSTKLNRIISCEYNNCLYITESTSETVYRFDLASNVVTQWTVGGKLTALSLTKGFNVLCMTTNDQDDQLIHFVIEYDTHGALLATIKLDGGLGRIRHCVQLSTDSYVICHGGKEHQVCIVNRDGVIVNFHKPSPGSAFENMNPVHMCVDTYDDVLVVDGNSNRILLLSSSLLYLGDLVVPGHENFVPQSLHLDELNHRLYIKEYNSEWLLAVDIKA